MGTVDVAQHLYAISAGFRYNDVPRAVKRYAAGLIELHIPLANGAQVHPIDVAEYLNLIIVTIVDHQITLPIKRDGAGRILKLPITNTWAADGAHEACTQSRNFPQTPRQNMAPRQNAGGPPKRMRDWAFDLETQEPHGNRHGHAAAAQDNLPLFGSKMGAECAPFCGSDMRERWALAEDVLQLLLVGLERA